MHKFLINAPAHTGHKQELRLKVPGIQRNEESEGRQMTKCGQGTDEQMMVSSPSFVCHTPASL